MSSEFAIELDAIKKTFHIYARPIDRLAELLHPRSGAKFNNAFQALQGVSARIAKGETVGIVGKNGSGKSTLLQIVCGTLQPTSGDVKVRGRIAALLELGAGFNPEFTGRENVYLNGTVLGLSRDEIDRRFDSILHFADIGDFIDRPVKTYSSGMYVRLAFAVAISIEPEILVVDEALSVGDEAFQRKCYARIESLKRKGTTILFVSHSSGSIVELCDRAILLDEGELLLEGDPKKIISSYQRLLYAPPELKPSIREEFRTMRDLGSIQSTESNEPLAGGDDIQTPSIIAYNVADIERYDPALKSDSVVQYEPIGARITDPHFTNANGQRVNVLVPGEKYRYRYRVEFYEPAQHVHFGMMIKSVTGIELFGMASHAEGDSIPCVESGDVFDVAFDFKSSLLPGMYFTNAGVNGERAGSPSEFLHRILDAVVFRVEARLTNRRKVGYYDLSLEPAASYRKDSSE